MIPKRRTKEDEILTIWLSFSLKKQIEICNKFNSHDLGAVINNEKVRKYILNHK